MSRSGYSDDYGDDDPLALGRWRAAVNSAIRGKRGQAFLREMLTAMDALPEKKLISGDLVKDGCACALGTVALARGLDVSEVDPEDFSAIGPAFGVADAFAREVMFMNDEGSYAVETPEERFARMRLWIETQIKPVAT